MNTQQPLYRAFIHAWHGLRYFFGKDRNGRIHLCAAILVCAAGWYFGVSPVQWMLLCLCIAMVLGLEMINHALEKLCDMVHPEWHPTVKTIKDVSAAAVLLAAMASVVVGLIIFLPAIQSIL